MKYKILNKLFQILKKYPGYTPVVQKNQNKICIVQRTTNICNNDCIFCIKQECFSNFQINLSPPDTKAFKNIIKAYPNYIKDELNIKASPDLIAFTTGEPTLRNDLSELIHFSINKFPKAEISLLTNGRRFSSTEYTQKFKTLTPRISFEIPLHSYIASKHDYITRRHGSFQDTIKGIINLKEINAKVNIRILINKNNYKDLEKIVNLTKSLNINSINLIYLSMAGKAEEHPEENFISPKQISPILNKTLENNSNIKFGLLNIPLCFIDKSYWKFNAGQTLLTDKTEYADICLTCSKKQDCCGFWKSKFNKKIFSELKPIK